jgi:hypothetical protein
VEASAAERNGTRPHIRENGVLGESWSDLRIGAVDGLHPLQRVRAACLVGETGKIYMYDFEKEPTLLAWSIGHERRNGYSLKCGPKRPINCTINIV